jgi:hypothetical protein
MSRAKAASFRCQSWAGYTTNMFEFECPMRTAYGSGLVCEYLASKGLISACWLAQSKGWPNYQAYKASNQWHLSQEMPTTCSGWTYLRDPQQSVEFDFDQVNGSKADFGQWATARPNTIPIARPSTCPPLAVNR